VDDSRETVKAQKVIGVRRLKEPMPTPIKTRIFTIANQKGGVGKTTTTVNIAAALAMGGLKVLVIDLDPQGNACTALGVDREELDGMFQVLVNDQSISSIVQKVAGFPHLECAPADIELRGAEMSMANFISAQTRLKLAINTLLAEREARGERLDYIFIDCPPSLGLLTINALAAADEILIPIQCEYYSIEGVKLLRETVEQIVRTQLNKDLVISTVVLTMFDSRTRLANDVANLARQTFPRELIDIPVPRAVRVSEAPAFMQTVMTWDASSPGAVAYMGIAREIAIRGSALTNNNNENGVSA
jgi:chromosome partitioning protein